MLSVVAHAWHAPDEVDTLIVLVIMNTGLLGMVGVQRYDTTIVSAEDNWREEAADRCWEKSVACEKPCQPRLVQKL